VDRFKLAAGGLATAVLVSGALAGCSAGQVSQTAMQQAAVNGSSADVGPLALRNVHIRAIQKSDFIDPGADTELLFQVANVSPDVNDKLVAITSDVGTVSLTGDTSLPAGGTLVVGAPDGQIAALDAVESAGAAKATVALTKPITNGLNYNFTFKFEKAGEATVVVPLSAGEQPRRDAVQDTGKAGGHEGGH
jgi:hypothetical protein